MADSIADVMRGFALAFVLGAFAFVLAQCGDVDYASAQDSGNLAPVGVDDAVYDGGETRVRLELARAIAGEAGLDASPDEAAAIGSVLLRRGLRYSAAIRTCRREWVCSLSPDGSEPAGWPSSWSWERNRPRWLRLYAHAGRIVRGEVRASCEADHFGSAEDAHRAWRAGWTQVVCGRGVRNWFWRVPR